LHRYPTAPKTFGEHLRKKQVDMQLSMTQLANLLGLGISDSAIEKWEKNQNHPTDAHRKRIIEFLGFNPGSQNPTGDSCGQRVGNLSAVHRRMIQETITWRTSLCP
jgi:transcriptional regulator with XRE-family HTH domain